VTIAVARGGSHAGFADSTPSLNGIVAGARSRDHDAEIPDCFMDQVERLLADWGSARRRTGTTFDVSVKGLMELTQKYSEHW